MHIPFARASTSIQIIDGCCEYAADGNTVRPAAISADATRVHAAAALDAKPNDASRMHSAAPRRYSPCVSQTQMSGATWAEAE
jgi:hypothetical protein